MSTMKDAMEMLNAVEAAKSYFTVVKDCDAHSAFQAGWLARAEAEGKTEVVTISREVYEFLMGSGPLDGLWYGDRPAAKPMYWWRNHLPSPPKEDGE